MAPASFPNLEQCIDSFLLQYRHAKHATTGESPSKLFKNRAFRTSLHSVSSAEVTFFKGTRQEMARGVVMQNLGNRMVTIMDLGDGSVHRRHYDQIYFQGQETEQDGANPEDVDPDEHSEQQRFMPYMLKPSVVALSGKLIPVTSVGTNDAPSDRCLGTAQGARKRHRGPGPPSTRESSPEVPNNGERCRGTDLPILWKRDPGSEVPNISERCHRPDITTNNERYPGIEVLGGSPRLAAMVEATGSQDGRGGPQAIRKARPEKKQRSQADVVSELYCFV